VGLAAEPEGYNGTERASKKAVRASRVLSGVFMVTMNDIAVRLGVSRATVSYVINERETGISIRDETRQRILATALEMGYYRNDLARAVVTGKNYVLGFFDHNPGSEVSSRVMLGAQEEADKSGYFIKQFSFMAGCDYTVPVRRCIEQRLAGVLAISFNEAALQHLHDETTPFNMPVVLLDDSPPQPWAARVLSDSEQGLRLGLEHLVSQGHRRIGFISAQHGGPLSEIRATQFRELCTQMSLTFDESHMVWTDWEVPEIIEDGVRSLLGREGRPTAIMCAGDKIALIAQRAARSIGLRLPQDLSIVGFADYVFAPYADPPLTTISQPFEEMGRIATRRLLKAIAGQDDGPEVGDLRVPTTLIVRSSTAPLNSI
jgi:DNA-binding LacI/PurR family transcriptional regulator